MRFGGRAEVEDPRSSGPGEQGVALALVERPVADLGGRDVADVALIVVLSVMAPQELGMFWRAARRHRRHKRGRR